MLIAITIVEDAVFMIVIIYYVLEIYQAIICHFCGVYASC